MSFFRQAFGLMEPYLAPPLLLAITAATVLTWLASLVVQRPRRIHAWLGIVLGTSVLGAMLMFGSRHSDASWKMLYLVHVLLLPMGLHLVLMRIQTLTVILVPMVLMLVGALLKDKPSLIVMLALGPGAAVVCALLFRLAEGLPVFP